MMLKVIEIVNVAALRFIASFIIHSINGYDGTVYQTLGQYGKRKKTKTSCHLSVTV